MVKSSVLPGVFLVVLSSLALIWARYKESPQAQTQTQVVTRTRRIIKPKMEEKKMRVIRMKVTAYCPCKECCGKFADGRTSRGKDAWKTLGVAADPELLQYGTKLVIPGIGVREVDDTGGAMRQSAKKGIWHIDVRFHNHQEARNFGVKWLNVATL